MPGWAVQKWVTGCKAPPGMHLHDIKLRLTALCDGLPRGRVANRQH